MTATAFTLMVLGGTATSAQATTTEDSTAANSDVAGATNNQSKTLSIVNATTNDASSQDTSETSSAVTSNTADAQESDSTTDQLNTTSSDFSPVKDDSAKALASSDQNTTQDSTSDKSNTVDSSSEAEAKVDATSNSDKLANSNTATGEMSNTNQTKTAVNTALKTPQVKSLPAILATKVVIGDTTKYYDDSTATPTSLDVALGDGLTAPTGWYAQTNAGQYTVLLSSGDFDTSDVQQDAGTYSVTLSAAGLAKLNSINKNANLTANDVTAGHITITKAPIPANAITVSGGSKVQDNDATTNPTSYTVTLPSYLTGSTDWTPVTDATGAIVAGQYTVSVDSGDIDAAITSQNVGNYAITLSAQGLQKLQDLNKNFDIKANSVAPGSYVIQNNVALAVGGTTIKVNQSLPQSLYVTVANGTNATVPSDWTVFYTNTEDGSVVYTVPIANFDTSQVNTATAGSYAVNLTSAEINQLNSSNPTLNLNDSNMVKGTINVSDSTSNASLYQANYYVDISTQTSGVPHVGLNADGNPSQTTNYNNYIIAQGSSLPLSIPIVRFNGGLQTITNLTEFLVIPAGFVAGDVDESGNAVVSTDPQSTVTQDINNWISTNNINASGLTVTPIAGGYEGRQKFKIHFDSVTLPAPFTDASSAATVSIVPDPNSSVTSGWIGPYIGAKDSAVMYLTDNYSDTQGAYTIAGYGFGYQNIPQVATALGIDDAVVLNSSYPGFIWHYDIVKATVTDTYNFVDPNGNSIATPVTTTGTPDSSYATADLVPATIVHNGITYQLEQDSVNAINTFPKVTTTFKASQANADGTYSAKGNTYTVKYQQVVNANSLSFNDGVQNQAGSKVYDGTTVVDATQFKLTGINGLINPTWDNSDFDLSGIDSAEAGIYPVSLNATGLSKLAAANPDYLFDATSVKSGTFTITPAAYTGSITVGDSSKTYDGTTSSDTSKYTVTLGDDLTAPTWTADDFDLSGINSPNVGNYTVTLSAAGIAAIEAVNPNYTFTSDNVTAGTFTINQAEVTIKANDQAKTYDGLGYTGVEDVTMTGKPANGAAVNYTLSDLSDDINAGTYTIAVTANTADNPNYDIKVVSGKLTITPAQPAGPITLAGKTKTYDGDASTDPTTYTVTLPAGLTAPTWTAEDFDLSGITSQDVGSYPVKLSEQGIAALKAANPNYDLSAAVFQTGSLNILQRQISSSDITIQNVNKFYDGDATTDPKTYDVIFADVPGSGLTASAWTAADFDLSGITSQNVGQYAVKLSAKGLADLQAANPNYQITGVTEGFLTISPAPITIIEPTINQKYTGQSFDASQITPEIVGKPALGVAINFESVLSGDGVAIGSYAINANLGDNPNYDIKVIPGTVNIVNDNYTVTTNYVDQNGNPIADSTVQDQLNVNDSYTTSAKIIPGYHLVKTEGDPTGTVGDGDVVVTYVYAADSPTGGGGNGGNNNGGNGGSDSNPTGGGSTTDNPTGTVTDDSNNDTVNNVAPDNGSNTHGQGDESSDVQGDKTSGHQSSAQSGQADQQRGTAVVTMQHGATRSMNTNAKGNSQAVLPQTNDAQNDTVKLGGLLGMLVSLLGLFGLADRRKKN
ncbi:LPXTG cell wall anchor domain-containing protein [Lactobacillus sp. LC28-10]|uniref:LPXTG cell wall anchor domain-containing protein n=1 Tax=Secundilactobacillus angelensis TaxID=2722706 RepID=A0ABX1KV32_9LACO|nr:MucBP domain-containing protein [Secundilactobacillus angelensis]NLR17802.1 LPXTG cell wall anchor domain-containing protein [Secundilactobacillus angelensis]